MPGDFEIALDDHQLSLNTSFTPGNQWYHPVLGGAASFSGPLFSLGLYERYQSILGKLDADDYSRFVSAFLDKGIKRFGASWKYADICTALLVLSNMLDVADYLEIGVRRGRSMAMVASQRPACRIVGFDMWMENYAGMDNPGPEQVSRELSKCGFQGDVEFVTGNSHETVPRYLEENPDRFFDLITVDGDHSEQGAYIDLLTVLPRLKIGGAIVFDDIAHPAHPYLARVWDKAVASRPQFSSFAFTELGYGVAFAVRHS